MVFRTAALFALISVAQPLSGQSQRKLVQLDFVSSPDRLADALPQVQLIVLGQVQSTEQAVTGSGQTALPTLRHSIRIMETWKGKATQSVVQVAQPGGVAVIGGIEVAVDDRSYHYLAIGETYVLFLKHDRFFAAYTPAFGSFGVYSVRQDDVRMNRAAMRVAEFEGRRTWGKGELRALLARLDPTDRR